MFNCESTSTFGTSVPTWLSEPGSVFLKRHKRANKYDSVVDKVDLIHATPNYAVVRISSGRETTMSLRDIALFIRVKCYLNLVKVVKEAILIVVTTLLLMIILLLLMIPLLSTILFLLMVGIQLFKIVRCKQ